MIYGIDRPMASRSREEFTYFGWPPDKLEEWIRKSLPLKPSYSTFDYTPEGKVALLRLRGYSDEWIARTYPDLATALR